MRGRSDGIRTALIVAVTVVATSVLGPIGAQAAGQLMTIVDSNSESMAQVDAGRLRVGDGSGHLTVNGTVRSFEAGTPIKIYFTDYATGTSLDSTSSYTVPAGKRLTVTRVSGYFEIDSTEAIELAYLLDTYDTDPGAGTWPAIHYFAYDTSVSSGGERLVTIEDSGVFTVQAGDTISMHADRTAANGEARMHIFVHGYLTPA